MKSLSNEIAKLFNIAVIDKTQKIWFLEPMVEHIIMIIVLIISLA